MNWIQRLKVALGAIANVYGISTQKPSPKIIRRAAEPADPKR